MKPFNAKILIQFGALFFSARPESQPDLTFFPRAPHGRTTSLTCSKPRRFLPLFITQFLGAFNDNVYKNALVILITYVVAEKAGLSSQIMITAAAGIFILPFFLFSATAGQLADKYEKAFLIRIIKLVEILLMIGATVGFYMGNIWFLMTILFLMGAQSTFFGPIKYGILPEKIEEDELIGGNGLIEAGTFISILIGTLVGGLLILAENGIPMISGMVILIAILGLGEQFLHPKRTARLAQTQGGLQLYKGNLEDRFTCQTKPGNLSFHSRHFLVPGSWGLLFWRNFRLTPKILLEATNNWSPCFYRYSP